jgi:hypothetical protein
LCSGDVGATGGTANRAEVVAMGLRSGFSNFEGALVHMAVEWPYRERFSTFKFTGNACIRPYAFGLDALTKH